MTTQQRIEKKGYKVTHNMGYKNDEQTIVSVSAEKNGMKITKENITSLFKAI